MQPLAGYPPLSFDGPRVGHPPISLRMPLEWIELSESEDGEVVSP